MAKPALVQVERTALAQVTQAEIDMQVSTAKSYPRDLAEVQKQIVAAACISQESAQAMTYELPPRKNKEGKIVRITGKSVRLAEIVAQVYGNLHVAVRSSEPGPGDRTVSAVATAWDLETNTRIGVEKSRRITNSEGFRYNDDMIVMTMSAASSIAYRDVIFKVANSTYVEAAYKVIRDRALGDPAKLAEARQLCLEKYAADPLKLTEAEMCRLVQRKALGELTLEDLRSLAGFLTGLNEGTVTADILIAQARGLELDIADLVDEAGVKAENDAKGGPKPPQAAQGAPGAPTPPKGSKGPQKGAGGEKGAQTTL